jgi:hypothetical protein
LPFPERWADFQGDERKHLMAVEQNTIVTGKLEAITADFDAEFHTMLSRWWAGPVAETGEDTSV